MIQESMFRAREVLKTEKLAAFSFDIFDTFILRRTTSPDGVYERAFHNAPIPGTHKHMTESFVQNRMIAEQKARQIRARKEQKEEVSIDEIYAYFPVHVFGLTASSRAALVEAEFNAELELCMVNPEILEFYNEAKAKNIKVGFLSDTYWSKEQLTRLLNHVAPGIRMNFLYASCEFGTGKSQKLFSRYLRNEEMLPKYCAHIGDNIVADVNVPMELGIQAVHYPQAADSLHVIFRREKAMMRLIQSQRASSDFRIDNGLNLIRRFATARLQSNNDLAETIGVGMLGPVMTAFHRFTEHRVNTIRSAPGKKVVVFFLARDGYLPLRIWDGSPELGAGHYVEINRRLSMMMCADDIEVFQEFFRMLSVVDESGVREFMKMEIPSVQSYFKKIPGGRTTGKILAEALPHLLDRKQIDTLADGLRKRFFHYLKHAVPDFADCTDVMLVDMGYSGTIQHSLRKAFDREGHSGKNLHGIYVATVDSKFVQLREQDSVAGFIDSSIVSPTVQHAVLRNIGIFEQLCVAPGGSIKGYDGLDILREEDPRPKEQLQLCTEIQDACVRFAREYKKIAAEIGADPFADMALARLRGTAIMARMLLAPTVDEQNVLGSLKHDVNLGTGALMSMIDMPEIEKLLTAMSLSQACSIGEPPAWLSGSFAALAPLSNYAYLTSSFGFCEGGILDDINVGTLPVSIVKDGITLSISGNCDMTATGDVRISIPILKNHQSSLLAIPLMGSLCHGNLRAIALQQGNTLHDAMHERHIELIPLYSVRALQTTLEGTYYKATGENPYLLVDIPVIHKSLLVVTLTLTQLPAWKTEEALSTDEHIFA